MKSYLGPITLLALLLISQSAGATIYLFQTIDFPGQPSSTDVHGINDNGDIVGVLPQGITANGGGPAVKHGFLYSKGTFTAIDVFSPLQPTPLDGVCQPLFPDLPTNCAATCASGINNSQAMVGNFVGPGGDYGFTLVGSKYSYCPRKSLWKPFPRLIQGYCRGINNQGMIVGDNYGQSFVILPVEPLTGNLVAFFPQAHATGINDHGTIVGDSKGDWNDANDVVVGNDGYLAELRVSVVRKRLIRSVQTVTSIDFPGASGTVARGINNSGEIVGYYADKKSINHGYTAQQGGSSVGAFSALDVPGSTDTRAEGINNSGQIVGSYGTNGFLATPFIILPIPHPLGQIEFIVRSVLPGDTRTFEPSSVQLAATGRSGVRPEKTELEESPNPPGKRELHLFYKLDAAGLHCGDNDVSVSGRTRDGQPIAGTQPIHIGC
jgi:hypothetical protein